MGRSVAARFQVPAANLQAAGAARRRGQVGGGSADAHLENNTHALMVPPAGQGAKVAIRHKD